MIHSVMMEIHHSVCSVYSNGGLQFYLLTLPVTARLGLSASSSSVSLILQQQADAVFEFSRLSSTTAARYLPLELVDTKPELKED